MKLIRASLFVIVSASVAGISFVPHEASAHCQVPCGIYSDHMRVKAMFEDADTVLKAAKSMAELEGKADAQSQQQFVRWVTNKEQHAQKIITTIADYYLTQRVKPSQSDYAERLEKHHAVILAAMKAKQHADSSYGDALLKAISGLKVYYPDVHTH